QPMTSVERIHKPNDEFKNVHNALSVSLGGFSWARLFRTSKRKTSSSVMRRLSFSLVTVWWRLRNGYQGWATRASRNGELPLVLMRPDHVADLIVNANHSNV